MVSTGSGVSASKIPIEGYIAPEGHIHFYSTPVMKKYFGKLGFSGNLDFEPKAYEATGRLFQLLLKDSPY